MAHLISSALTWARGRSGPSVARFEPRFQPPTAPSSTDRLAATALLRSLPFQCGVAGVGHAGLLAALGCNALRTWGADQLSEALLDECARCGVRVWAGLWIQSAPPAGRAHDAERAAIVARVVADVGRWRHHAAIVGWVVGNEVELRSGCLADALALTRAAATAVAAADPGRVIATALADGGADKWRAVAGAPCPGTSSAAPAAIDVLLVNAYGGLSGLRDRLAAGGYRGAYAVGEGLAGGHWEAPTAPWGAPLEPPSVAKAAHALEAAAAHVLPAAAALGAQRTGAGCSGTDGPTCIGVFAFFGGHKVEATPTWYSLFTADGAPDGPRLAALARVWRAAKAVEAGASPLAQAHASLLQPQQPDALVAAAAGALDVPAAAPSGIAVNGAVVPYAQARCGDVVTVQAQLLPSGPLLGGAAAASVEAAWEVWTDGATDGGSSGAAAAQLPPHCVLQTGTVDAVAPAGLRLALPPGRYRVAVTVRSLADCGCRAGPGPLAALTAAVATANVPLLLTA